MNVIKKTEVLMGISGSLDSLGRSTCKSSKWRQGGLVVSTLDFSSEGWWFQPGLCCHTGDYNIGGSIPCDELTSHFMEAYQYSQSLHAMVDRVKCQPDGSLGS